jgi:hypothetical protein
MVHRYCESIGGPFVVAAAAFVAALAALVALPGADSLWLVAFGRAIAHGHGLGAGVPYAAAPTQPWGNVPAVAELVFWALNALAGVTALVAANAIAVLIGFSVLGMTMRRAGAREGNAALMLILVAAGAISALVVVRAQFFSVALFPVLLALLHSETRSPSRRIWLLLPLMALWSSLHGAVLVGALVAGAWLVLGEIPDRPLEGIGVLLLLPLAICATPALEHTPRYYADVAGNVAAQRSFGLWAPVSLDALGVIFLFVAFAIVALALAARPALWEMVAMFGLALLTTRSVRGGVWLLMVAAVPAARRVVLPRVHVRARVGFAMIGLSLILAVIGLVHVAASGQPGQPIVARAVELSRGFPILAEPFLAERVAADGGRVWIADPLDAFDKRAQSDWLDWLQGRHGTSNYLARRGRYLLVVPHSSVDARVKQLRMYRRLGSDSAAVLYVRRDAG